QPDRLVPLELELGQEVLLVGDPVAVAVGGACGNRAKSDQGTAKDPQARDRARASHTIPFAYGEDPTQLDGNMLPLHEPQRDAEAHALPAHARTVPSAVRGAAPPIAHGVAASADGAARSGARPFRIRGGGGDHAPVVIEAPLLHVPDHVREPPAV